MVPLTVKERFALVLPTRFRAYLAARKNWHQKFVAPPDTWDVAGASQFNLLTLLGLRDHHYLLDVGCGSLRAGRLFITYLQPDRYFGIEPEKWLVESAIQKEVGRDLIRIKRPVFDHNKEFRLSVFNQLFDFILVSSIFAHAAQSQIEACLREARQVMKPTTYFLANFAHGSSNYDGDEFVYPDMVTYTIERMCELAEAQGMECELLDWPYLYGAKHYQTWLVFTLAEQGRNTEKKTPRPAQ